MPKRTVVIVTWPYGDEYVVLPAALLEKSDEVTVKTTDFDKEDGSESTYFARARSRREGPRRSTVELVYDVAQNQHLNAKRRRELEWGSLTIAFNGSTPDKIARWQAEGSDDCWEGPTVTKPGAKLTGESKRRLVNVLQRAGQAAAREQLLLRYKACSLTGESTKEALEAAHIVRATAGGVFDIGNGLLLRADLHRLFDAGYFDFDTDGRVRLAAEKQGKLSIAYKKILKDAAPLKPDVLELCGRALRLRAKRKRRKQPVPRA